MKKSFIMTWDECQYLKGSRYEMGLQMYNFEQLTGISVQYERQGYNGDDGSNWLWFGTNDNDGLGMYVEVKGPKEAAETLYKMCNDFRTFGEFWFY